MKYKKKLESFKEIRRRQKVSRRLSFYPKELNMKYKITLTESNKGSVIVEALNREHAIDKAMEAYHNGNIDWEYALPTISKVELIKEPDRGR